MSVEIAAPFVPACMNADEIASWAAMRDRSTNSADRSAIPCSDCLLGYAAEMRAVGLCNGTPHGVEEEEDMDQTEPIAARPARRMALDISPPPCASCSHEPVCALRAAFEGMASVEIGALSVPSGLRLAIVGTVECEHFLRDRAKSTADWTPERRAAQGDRMRARLAREKAEREAAGS